MKNTPGPNRVRIWLFVAVAVGAVLRLYGLGTYPPGCFVDEGDYIEYTRSVLAGIWRPQFYEWQPVYCPFAVLGCLLGGLTPFGLRLGSAIAGVLTIPVCYWSTAKLTGRRTAVIATLLLAILPWHIILSRIGFRAVTMPLFIFATVGFTASAVRRSNAAAAAMAILMMVVGFYTYVPFVMMPASLGLLICIMVITQPQRTRRAVVRLLQGKSRHLAILILVITVIAGIFLFEWSGRVIVHPRTRSESNLSAAKPGEGPLGNAARTAAMFVWKGDAIPRHNPPGASQTPRWAFPFLVVGAILAFRKRANPANAFLLIAFLLFLLPGVLGKGAAHGLRTSGVIVPFVVLTAMGLRWSASRVKWVRRRRAIIGATLFVMATALSAHAYFVQYGQSLIVWRAFDSQFAQSAEIVRRLPAGSIVMHEPAQLPRAFFTLIHGSGVKMKPIASPRDLATVPPVSNLFAMFIGHDRFGGEFVRRFPTARRIQVITGPDKQPAAVIFRVR